MKKRSLTYNLSLAVVSMLALPACGSEQPEDQQHVIQLGVVLDRTGTASDGSMHNSASLAEEHMNAALSAAGSNIRFELVGRDSAATPAIATQEAQDLIANVGVKGLVTGLSVNTHEINMLNYPEDPANAAEIPIVAAATTFPLFNVPTTTYGEAGPDNDAYRDEDNWMFRTSMSAAPQSKVLADMAMAMGAGSDGDMNEDAVVKVSIYREDTGYGVGITNPLVAALQGLGADYVEVIVQDSTKNLNDTAHYLGVFDQLVDGMTMDDGGTPQADAPADVTMAMANPDNVTPMVRARGERNSSVPMLLTARSDKLLENLPVLSEGAEGLSTVMADGQTGELFTTELAARFNSVPTNFDASSYDAASVLMLAALSAAYGLEDPTSVTPTAIRDEIVGVTTGGTMVYGGASGFEAAVREIVAGNTVNFDGAAGPADMDAGGDVRVRLSHFVIENGAFKDIATFDCVADFENCPRL